MALIVFRLGTFIPLPGIDARALSEIFSQHSNGILGMFNMFSGGALSRMTIFALNIFLYISASIIIQLGQSVIPSLAALKKEDEAGHRKVTHYTKILTVFITIIQDYGIAVGLESMSAGAGAQYNINDHVSLRLMGCYNYTGIEGMKNMFDVTAGARIYF